MDKDPLIGTTVDGYEIVSKVTEGAMASIYLANHPGLEKRAAVKVISRELSTDRQAVARFLVEARSANWIAHPNVIDVFGYGRLPGGRNYFIMEWLDGQTLRSRIADGKVPLGEAIDILLQTSDALSATHEKGIVHRDVKSENIFLARNGSSRCRVKLLDFGVAKIMSPAGGDARRTELGSFIGTPHYSSPEQTRGIAIDERSDVYSLGVTAYETILGQLPFNGDPMEVLTMQLSDPPPRPSTLWKEIPIALERLLLAMLDKSPAKRPSLGSMRTVLLLLRARLSTPIPDLDSYYDTFDIATDLVDPAITVQEKLTKANQ